MSSMSILAFFLILNAITCILYGIDKWKAIHGAWRIREITLLTWTALGGSLGAFLGMHLFHHKTRHKKFRLLTPFFLAVHLLILAWLIVHDIGFGK